MFVSQQLKLNVIWVKNFLGFAVDQTIEKTSYPLTSYYIWPRTEAWEQLKLELDSKSWLNAEEKIQILNLVSSIMGYWRQNRDGNTPIKEFPDIKFLQVKELGL